MKFRLPAFTFALAVALLTAGTAGCISYRLDQLPEAPSLPIPSLSDSRPSLVYTLTATAGTDLMNTGANNNGFPEMDLTTPTDELSAMLQRSAQFRSVQKAGEGREGDVQLDVVLTVEGNDVVVLVSAVTFTLIPMWRTVTWELTAEARARDGRLHRYEMQDAARDIFWLPIILGMSIRPWGEAYHEVRDNMYRTLLARMHADGLLGPASGPVPR